MLSDHVNCSLWSMWLVVHVWPFKEWSEAPLCLCAENGCMYSFCGGNIFMMQMMFSVDMLNTKVIYNVLIFLFLKIHDFRTTGLGVIDFRSLLLGFAGPLNRSEWLYCLAYLDMESCIGDNIRVVVLLLSFLKCLWSLLLVVQNSSYSYSKWNGIFLSKSG